MKATISIIVFFVSFFHTQISLASQYIEVVDVGAGLCVIGVDNDNLQYFVYDSGNWKNKECFNEVRHIVKSSNIAMLILSHSDSDHIGNTYELEKAFTFSKLVHTGYKRERVRTWVKSDSAIQSMIAGGTIEYNLAKNIELPDDITVGAFKLNFIYGLDRWEGDTLAEAESRNVISIVVKVTLGDNSVLLSGDIIGRKPKDSNEQCRYAEELIVKSDQDIKSDVLVAPHHGANNASSECFLKAVNPRYIVYSAGHNHSHPRFATVDRAMHTLNIDKSKLFRTDRGDDEGPSEWDYLRISKCIDREGDDSVIIDFTKEENVFYKESKNICTN